MQVMIFEFKCEGQLGYSLIQKLFLVHYHLLQLNLDFILTFHFSKQIIWPHVY